MRITNQMIDNVSVYNMNTNKTNLDRLNNQMSSRKKYSEPMDDPVTAIRSLRFRGSLSELTQYLEKNVTDASSWTDSTQTAIDTSKELMRSLKAEYVSASNGTNETSDRWTYYENMLNVVNELFSVGNSTNENRYIFTGARTLDSLTFTDKNFADRAEATGGIYLDDHVDTYKYRSIKENFELEDVESYSYTARTDKTGSNGSSGVKENEIVALNNTDGEETHVENVEAYRLRLSYRKLDDYQNNTKLYINNGVSLTGYDVELIGNDYEVNSSILTGNNNKIFLNYTTGNLIFGGDIKEKITDALSTDNGQVYFLYDKSTWETGDAKPEHFFDCIDVGVSPSIVYDDRAHRAANPNSHEQDILYNVGDGQNIKINTNAEDVFSLDARRDLDELYDALTAKDEAEKKMDLLNSMKEDTVKYGDDVSQEKISELMNSVNKELEYISSKIDGILSNGITRAEKYFNKVNQAGTDMGSVVNRLNLIKNRLTENKATTTSQASDNENIDISTVAVDVNSASLSYSAALQVTGKISQQSLVNFL